MCPLNRRLTGLSAILLATASLTAAHAAGIDASRVLPMSSLQNAKHGTAHSSSSIVKSGTSKSFAIAYDGSGRYQSSTVTVGLPGVDTLANWSDQFTTPGYDSNGNAQSIWPYTMLGQPPEYGRTTTIGAPIIPVQVNLLAADGSVAVSFAPNGKVIQSVLNSPVFESSTYTSGTGQFNDMMFHAEFKNRINGGDEGSSGFHTLLAPSLHRMQQMNIPYLTPTGTQGWYVFVDTSGTPVLAAIDEIAFSNLLFPPTYPVTTGTVMGAAELSGAATTQDLSTFLYMNTVLFSNGDINQCCIIGFHSYDFEPGTAQNGNRNRFYVMNYASYLSPGLFLGGFEDITPWSHEIAETFHDPFVDNLTPWWLSVDPISGAGNCQNDLEVGDVIEVLTGLPVYSMVGKAMTYHPQNEAMFQWFEFQAPANSNLGAYSFPDETTLMSLSPGPLLPGCKPAP